MLRDESGAEKVYTNNAVAHYSDITKLFTANLQVTNSTWTYDAKTPV